MYHQDSLLAVLSHLLSGKSFELMLNAATGTGKFRAFSTKLVRFNEANRQPGTDSGKSANVRALLFDIAVGGMVPQCRTSEQFYTTSRRICRKVELKAQGRFDKI